MLSLTPFTPGLKQQTPRTIRSISTPACDARYKARITRGSTSAFILATMRAGRPSRACTSSRFYCPGQLATERLRRDPEFAPRVLLRKPGEVIEELGHVGSEFGVV